MAAEWYYAKGKQKIGPVTVDELRQLTRSGELGRNDMVWKEGMAKWSKAGDLKELFDAVPPPLPRPSVPPPLPAEAGGASADELKLPVIGMFVVSGLALFFGLIGVLNADSPTIRLLLALGVAHNLAALFFTAALVRLRNYQLASVAPWLVMTCWVWHWLTNMTHGIPLLGMVLAASAGVWAFVVLRSDAVRHAFEADPPLPPLFFAGQQTAGYELDAGTRFPWPTAERTASNPALRWLKVGMAASIVVGVLCLLSIVGAIFCLPFFSLAILIHILAVRPGRLHGRWVPAEEGSQGWIEFLAGDVYKQEDGTVGTYVLLPNQKFIDILAAGHLVDSWKILSWDNTVLEVLNKAGKTLGFKKGKTLAEKQVALFHTDRNHLLQRKWESVNGDSPAIQFTEDGAMIRFDGFAARYTLAGEEPNEVVVIHLDERQQVRLKVLSLSRDEMVLAGEGGTCHYRRGVSITDAESQRRADAAREQLKAVGKAALLTVGAIGAGIAILGVAAAASAHTTCARCGFTRVGLHSNCPNCVW